MEVVGGVASIVGIAQALAATPKIVAAIRAVAGRKDELSKLLKEVERLSATCQQIHDITRLLSRHLPDNVVAMLHAAEENLRDTVLELEKFGDKCAAPTRAQQDIAKAKPKAVRWLWMRPQLQQLYSRTRDTGNNLQMVLQLAHSHILHRMLIEGLHNATISAIVELAPPLPEVPHVVGELEADSDSSPPSPEPERELEPQPSAEASISGESIVASAFLANDTTTNADRLLQVTPLGLCSPGCQCSCHHRGSRTSVWQFSGLQKSLGALRVSHASRVVECDIPNCAREGTSAPLEVQYLFPAWLYAGVWAISASASSLTGLGSKIQFTHGRVLPSRALVSRYANQGSPADLQTLLNNGEVYYPSDLTIVDRGESLMEIAIMSMNIAVVEFLLQYWSPILKQTGVSKRTAALAARCLKYLGPEGTAKEASILRRVVELHPDPSFLTKAPEIHTAISQRNQKLLRILLDQDPSIKDSTGPYGFTPLHVAADESNLEALRTLSKAGVDRNIRDSVFDMTPLEIALNRGHLGCAKELITGGAVIPDNALCIPLRTWRAIQHPSLVDVLRLLLLRKPSLAHQRDTEGLAALHRAAHIEWRSEQQSIQVVQLLLEAGADVEAEDNLCAVPLWMALWAGNLGIASLLIKGGARIANVSRTKFQRNLLHDAAAHWTTETMRFVRDKTGGAIDVDCEQRDTFSCNPWDMFVMQRLLRPSYRKRDPRPHQASVTAFVDLFTVCRNRAIEHDIAVLENALRALEQRRADEARATLRPLAALKESQDRDAEVQTLHAIELQIREGMWEAAQESVEEMMVVRKDELETSPWQRDSRFDTELYQLYSKDELIALRGGIELERDDAYFARAKGTSG